MKDKFSIIIIVILTLMVIYLLATRGGSKTEGFFANEQMGRGFSHGVLYSMIRGNHGAAYNRQGMGALRPYLRRPGRMAMVDSAFNMDPCFIIDNTPVDEFTRLFKANRDTVRASVCTV